MSCAYRLLMGHQVVSGWHEHLAVIDSSKIRNAQLGKLPYDGNQSVLILPVQFLYMLLVGTFPFNSFLAGILCCLAFFSLTGEWYFSSVSEQRIARASAASVVGSKPAGADHFGNWSHIYCCLHG
jgi:hypothetical protein